MTSQIRERAERIAFDEWAMELDRLPQDTKEDIVRRAAEEVRTSQVSQWVRMAKGLSL
jgi:hypothetical protein